MKYAYKTEIKPTKEQAEKIRRSIGICRWLYNKYIGANKQLYRMYQRGLLDDKQSNFMTAIDFDKYVNRKLKTKAEYKWINKCGSKARKKILLNAEMAFKNFFAAKSSSPQFKRKTSEDIKLYFPKNNEGDWAIERHRIKIPTLKYVRLKEYGYLPTNAKVINGSVSCNAGRYYVSITVEQETEKYIPQMKGIGLCIRFKDLNKVDDVAVNENRVNKIYRKIEQAQKILQRKYSHQKMNDNKSLSCNLEKQRQKLQRLRRQLDFIRNDYMNKQVAQIIRLRPQYIVMEPFDMEKMVSDKNIKRGTARAKYYDLKNRLLIKCQKYNLELKETEHPAKEAEMILMMDIV